ncbi:MAG: hypothetical protein Q8R70_02150 [Methanoregula sp.]|nr:hypothetical protein [Methanoregula sp.]
MNQIFWYGYGFFLKKWGILFKALIIMLFLLVPRTVIDIFRCDTVPINPVVGAFITGAIFTIAIIFNGTFTDFKESEKSAGEYPAEKGTAIPGKEFFFKRLNVSIKPLLSPSG